MWEVLSDPRAPRSLWSISQWLAIELVAYLERTRPRRILEVGSGYSTAILAAYAAQCSAQVVTLEHDARYRRLTANGLRRLELRGLVDLRRCPLVLKRFHNQEPYLWYDMELEGDFDFVFVDGPPKILGRRGVFFALKDHLRPGWRMWLDDGVRRHERQCIKLWNETFPDCFNSSRLNIDGKGIYVLEDKLNQRPFKQPASLNQLGIGVHGNGSTSWWRWVQQTVGSQRLSSIHVVVTAKNGAPERSLPQFASKFVNERLCAHGGSPQQRLTPMFDALARRQEVRYILYLDDAWSPSTLDGRWLSRALDIFEKEPTVDRITLQHQVDAAVQTTAAECGGWLPVTPSLLRVDGLGPIAPAGRMRSRKRSSLTRSRTKLGTPPEDTVQQLSPGVFRQRHGDGGPGNANPIDHAPSPGVAVGATALQLAAGFPDQQGQSRLPSAVQGFPHRTLRRLASVPTSAVHMLLTAVSSPYTFWIMNQRHSHERSRS